MQEYEKCYIECRFFIIGDRNVGKKSFIEKLLSVPSTSMLRNYEAENEFNKTLIQLIKENEQFEEELMNINDNKFNSTVKENYNTIKKLNRTKSMEQFQFSKTKNDFDFNKKYLYYNPNNIEGKKNKFLMKSFIKNQILTSRYKRPPIPEHPSKLFNINKSKIIFKPYYIFPAEELPQYYVPTEEDTTDYILEGNNKISIKGINKDIYRKINSKNTLINSDKLLGYQISIYNFFIFLYDLSDFSTFENLVLYFDKINNRFDITNNEDNNLTCIIGNKKDKKINFEKEQENKYNEFIKGFNNLFIYEISTKPFFNFNKFFYDFFFETLNQYHEKLFNEYNFKKSFEKIALNKFTFPKAVREIIDPTRDNPGPGYDLNIYGYSTAKELKEAFNDKKKRFNKKIFSNKQGPIISKSKSIKDLMEKEKKSFMPFIIQSKGGVLNKSPKGYSFGIVKGKLDLIKARKNMFLERNQDIRDTIEGDCTLYNYNPEYKSKDEDYFDSVIERKNQIFTNRNNENQKKYEKNLVINKNNLKAIEEKKEERKNFIITKLKLFKSSSSPNILGSSLTDENKTEKDFNKQRFCDVVYPKNKEHMEHYVKKRNYITKKKQYSETPGPNAYDIRTNMYDPKKGPFILERRKLMEYPKDDPSYPDFKDEFEIIVEKAEKYGTREKFYKPRFQDIVREKDPGPYPDQAIWQKWKKNKEKLENSGRIKDFIDYRKQKFNEHNENLIKIEKEKQQIREISRAILLKKGYEDPALIKNINYSLVEEASPKYTIKGKIDPKIVNYEDYGNNILMNDNEETMNAIKEAQLNRPLPDFNYIRPKLPSIIFSKAERFKKSKEYEGSTYLFKDGVFAPKTQKDFFLKEPFSGNAQRTFFGRTTGISPSPAEYKIKSSFEIIAEQGKKISDNKKEIQMKEMKRKKELEEKQNMRRIKESMNEEKNNNEVQNLVLSDDKNKESHKE